LNAKRPEGVSPREGANNLFLSAKIKNRREAVFCLGGRKGENSRKRNAFDREVDKFAGANLNAKRPEGVSPREGANNLFLSAKIKNRREAVFCLGGRKDENSRKRNAFDREVDKCLNLVKKLSC